MIIALSEEFDALDEQGWLKYLPAVEHLLTAHIEGWHILLPSRRTAEVLSKHYALSERHRLALSVYIKERLATLGGAWDSVKHKIICGIENAVSADAGVFSVPLLIFGDMKNCLPSRLIVENQDNDGKLYLKLASRLGNRNAGYLALEVINGGGDTTSKCVEQALLEQRPTLIVIDGDKNYRESKEGNTAKAVRKKFNCNSHSHHLLFVTRVKSAENLINIEMLAAALEGSEQSRQYAIKLQSFEQRERELSVDPYDSVLAYIDMKKGLRTVSLRLGSPALKNSIVRLLQHLDLPVITPDKLGSDDDAILVPGLNRRCLEKVVDLIHSSRGSLVYDNIFRAGLYYPELSCILEAVCDFGQNNGRLPIPLN